MDSDVLVKFMDGVRANGEVVQAQMSIIQQKLASLEKRTKAYNDQLQAQHQWLTALQTLVTANAGTLPIVVGVAAAMRQISLGKEWIDLAKRNALAQLPARDDPNSPDAKVAEFVSDTFDRIEIEARAAEGTGGMN